MFEQLTYVYEIVSFYYYGEFQPNNILLLFAILKFSRGANDIVKSPDKVLVAAAASKTGEKKTATAKSEKDLKVIQLNSRNFDKHLSDGNVWLIEFYSPNCIHCVEFAPTYMDIARQYHGSDANKIKVGKVNGEVERALVSRFAIYAFPSFYIVDGWSVYHFQQPRVRNLLTNYAEGGYKQTDSIPFYSSPMGPLGLMQGMLMSTGHTLSDVFGWTQQSFGLSPLVLGTIVFGSMFLGCFFIIVFLALVIPPRTKQD